MEIGLKVWTGSPDARRRKMDFDRVLCFKVGNVILNSSRSLIISEPGLHTQHICWQAVRLGYLQRNLAGKRHWHSFCAEYLARFLQIHPAVTCKSPSNKKEKFTSSILSPGVLGFTSGLFVILSRCGAIDVLRQMNLHNRSSEFGMATLIKSNRKLFWKLLWLIWSTKCAVMLSKMFVSNHYKPFKAM